jgi:hypothetical protein
MFSHDARVIHILDSLSKLTLGGKKPERQPKKMRYCRNCRKKLVVPHKCYIQPDVGADDKANQESSYYCYDFETYLDRDTNEHKPFLCVVQKACQCCIYGMQKQISCSRDTQSCGQTSRFSGAICVAKVCQYLVEENDTCSKKDNIP